MNIDKDETQDGDISFLRVLTLLVMFALSCVGATYLYEKLQNTRAEDALASYNYAV